MVALGGAYLQKDKDTMKLAKKLNNNDMLEKYLHTLDPVGYDPSELEGMKKKFMKKIKEEISSTTKPKESFEAFSHLSKLGNVSKPSFY